MEKYLHEVRRGCPPCFSLRLCSRGGEDQLHPRARCFCFGDITIPVGASINLASWWGIGQSLSNYYPEGDADRKFELWVSLKFVGPNFGLNTEDGKDRMVCDRFFLVDRNGRKYKGE